MNIHRNYFKIYSTAITITATG